MNAKIAALVLFLISGVLLGVYLMRAEEPAALASQASIEAPAVSEPAAPAPLAEEESPPVARGERVAALEPAEEEAAAEEPEAPVRVPLAVQGRVLDAEKNPVPGADLFVVGDDEEAIARSGSGGHFTFTTAYDGGVLEARRDGWVTVLGGNFQRDRSVAPVVVIAPALDLTGRVSDIRGRPLPDATVKLDVPPTFATHFGEYMAAAQQRMWRTESDLDGRFTMNEVPALPGGELIAVLDGYQPSRAPLPFSSVEPVEIVLTRPAAPEVGAVVGQVVDRFGVPVEGARVGLGLQAMLSDEEGRFHFDVARAITTERIVAIKAGYLPGMLERPGEPTPGAPSASEQALSEETEPDEAQPFETGWPDFVQVTLGDECLSFEGYVVNADGDPVPGVKVWVEDTTSFGPVGWMPTAMESLMAGAFVPQQVLTKSPYLPDQDSGTIWRHAMTAPPPSAFWNYDLTGEDGFFQLSGLFDREYTLSCLDTETLATFTSGPHAAGDLDLKLVVPTLELHDEVRGRVVLKNGDPVAGVRVSLSRDAYRRSSRVFGGTVDLTLRERREVAWTDEQGEFRFRDVPVEGMFLGFAADHILPHEVRLTEDIDPGDLQAVVEGRYLIEVRVNEPLDRVDSCVLRSVEGYALSVQRLIDGTTQTDSVVRLIDGRSGVMAVSGDVRTVEFLSGGETVESKDVDLVLGEVTRVDY